MGKTSSVRTYRIIIAAVLIVSLVATCAINLTAEASATAASKTYTEEGLGSVTVQGDYIAGKYVTLNAVGNNQDKYDSDEGEQGELAMVPYSVELEGPYDYWKSGERIKLGAPGRYTLLAGFDIYQYEKYGEDIGEWINSDYREMTRTISVKGKVVFDPAGGNVINKTRYRYAKKEVGSLPKAKWSNHKFKGWFTKKNKGTKIKATTKVVFGDSISKKYYAHWSNRVKVIFNANKGKASKKYKKVWSGEKYGKLPKAKRGEDKFKGWYTNKITGKKVTKNSKVPNKKKINLYAHWIKRVKVVFNANGGTCSKTYKKAWAGRKYGKLPKAKRSGYSFKGWYTKKSGGKKIKSYSRVSNKHTVRLYAHWKKNASATKRHSSSGGVYITATGIRYHSTRSCSGLRNANAVWPVSLSEAKNMGLTPCHICY